MQEERPGPRVNQCCLNTGGCIYHVALNDIAPASQVSGSGGGGGGGGDTSWMYYPVHVLSLVNKASTLPVSFRLVVEGPVQPSGHPVSLSS